MDQARFEQAWKRHSSAVCHYCAFSTGSREDAEDLTVETFSRLLRSGGRVNAEKLEAWLFAVARNLCASHHRSRFRSQGLLQRVIAVDPPSQIAADQAWRDPELWAHVRALDERSRLAVYLRVVEDRSFAQVAAAMGVSNGAAKMTYYRALERVRTSIAAEQAACPDDAPAFESAAAPVGGVSDAE